MRRCGSGIPVIDALEARAALVFEGPVRALLHAYKFHGYTQLAPRLARELTPILVSLRADAVVPVPLHWRRRWRRGHDQTAGLARGLRVDLPRLPVLRALRRARATPPQVGAGGAARRSNVRQAFRLRRGCAAAIRGCRIALLDDVVTTGSTLAAAAEPLRRAGAQDVVGVALAVSPRTPVVARRSRGECASPLRQTRSPETCGPALRGFAGNAR